MTNVFKNGLYAISLIIVLSACSKKDPTPTDPEAGLRKVDYEKTEEFTALERQYSTLNQAIYYVFRDWYLWNFSVPKGLNYTSYTPEKLIDRLRYENRDSGYADVFSFITSKEEASNLFDNGIAQGKGFDFGFDPRDGSIRVALVYKDSPAARAGLYRGVNVKKVNGLDVNTLLNSNVDRLVELLYADNTEYTFVDTTGNEFTKIITPGSISINTVLYHSIYQIADKKVGYLVFNSFLKTSRTELNNVFSEFSAQNIDELILDLRYNGGGLVDIAVYLASMLVGEKGKDQIFLTYKFNKDYAIFNESIQFDSEVQHKLNLARIFIITTEFTASSSELIINGLKPYMQVLQIGDNSFGKPVGFFPFIYQDFEIFPVSFESVNRDGNGRYFNGFRPDVYAYDGLFFDWGNKKEPSLHQALYYIQNSRFDGSQPQISARLVARSQGVKMPQRTGIQKIIGSH